MAQLTNDALLQLLAAEGLSLGDEQYFFAGAPTTQAGGAPFKSQVHRVVKNAVSGAAMTMKSLLSNDANLFCFLINDDPTNAVSVFCFPGEKMNGTSNGSFSVTAQNAAIFIGIPVQIARKGGSGGTLNWSAALISN
jgi:hypothetical protein